MSALIPCPYLLILTAYSFSIGSIVIDIRVGIKVVVGLRKSEGNKVIRVLRLRLRSEVEVEGEVEVKVGGEVVEVEGVEVRG